MRKNGAKLGFIPTPTFFFVGSGTQAHHKPKGYAQPASFFRYLPQIHFVLHIDIVTLHPELLEGPLSHSILGRARQKGLLQVELVQLRQYGLGRHLQVDDYAFGGGAGMVMMPEPLMACIEDLQQKRTYDEIIYMAPDGKLLDQRMANRLSLTGNLLILCGHYKGIDERIREHVVTLEISIGDYVLSGGELPAAVLIDAVGRLIPGVLNDESSALTDSFQDDLVAPPVYTRPAEYRGWKVPDVLLSGHAGRIEQWRQEQAEIRTRLRRPHLFSDDDV
jgi:tRNA (guanine37-N1)-methyltransferase